MADDLILSPSLIKYEINSKTDQTNWGHPQVAINVAQWISPKFDVQVSRWTRELKENNDKLLKENNILKSNSVIKYNKNLILNNITISVREDGYINATQICKAGKKLYSNWKQNKNTEDIIKEFELALGIPRSELLSVNTGGKNQGTYVHPQIAYHNSYDIYKN